MVIDAEPRDRQSGTVGLEPTAEFDGFVSRAALAYESSAVIAAREVGVIYMVEMDFCHPSREAEWNAWYLDHIKVLLTVPGFRASQRFKAIVDNPSPYLALHEVSGPEMFAGPAYRGRGGPGSVGEWHDLQSNWHRNLLEGVEETTEVPSDRFLLMLRDAPEGEDALTGGTTVEWLNGIGLDLTVARCGLAIIDDPAPLMGLARRDDRVRLYRPISGKILAGG